MDKTLNEIKKLFFMLIVEDISDIKELYKKDPLKAYELFEKRFAELKSKTSKPSKIESFKTNI